MKYFLQCFLPSLFLLVLVSCSSPKRSIRNIYAYNIVTTPGNIPVDRNGNSLYRGPDTSNIVYVEIKGKEPGWQYAWQHNRVYKLRPILISEKQVSVGKDKTTEEKILISTTTSNKLYQLVFEPSSEKIQPSAKIEGAEILLQGKFNGKTFFRKIVNPIELYQQPTE
jgi:hypothetical protein